ncbi:6-carboxytetrahydropterin synthase QueD [Abyssicoccus albus]|uniref:6-carboxy-5,6,7,8-tetrahydropterin synthase n=2 Tax=Abyssicoccus albus TaxID=1817405 RepID=A0A1Q1G2Y6_9BACL|nr:6-carboxytetrahydropterin synthase [Abyssicoccus albus]AQL56728.1 6-carboxytetrahydropterin synthase QueD [Abyssicoccus albus]RPF57449.1 preQ(0) biosynthesis protein QueD [Abyssicoccus albus]
MMYIPIDHNYSFELNKQFTVSSAHYIDHKEAGKCARIHGHNYNIQLTIGGDSLDELGFLVNFSLLKKEIHDWLDHQLINELPEFNTVEPSTEQVAYQIYLKGQHYLTRQQNNPKLLQVFVQETDSSYAIYRPKEHQS